MKEGFVYKVLTTSEWKTFQQEEIFKGNTADINDGFIHLCTEEQLDGVLERYYQGQKNLYMLSFDIQELGKGLVFEPSTRGELFPHLYHDHLKLNTVKNTKIINQEKED